MRKIAFMVACGAAAIAAGAAATPVHATSYSFKLLYAFCTAQNCADGSDPSGGVALDSKGNVYGTTQNGGADGAGVVFEITGGKEIVRHSFSFQSDGAFPAAGLIIDKSGDLFGTTQEGGTGNAGTVFALPAKGSLKVIDDLQCCQRPEAPVVMDPSGNLFGTATEGGDNGGGAVFAVSKKGQEQALYSFCAQSNCTDGKTPVAGLLIDKKGNLYGTTSEGGGAGQGVVFEVEASGKYKILCNFLANAKCTVGAAPKAGLVMDKKGNLYGTTSGGGDNNRGIVFALDSKGKETVLHSFCSVSGCIDGADPVAPLAMDKSGTLYGTTPLGGKQQSGTVFSVTAKGKFTVIYNFCEAAQCADGGEPLAGVTVDAKGNLYGTTRGGGVHGAGTAFELVKQ
jgi:uncharacterized repeat protein (TIGR03803 family)